MEIEDIMVHKAITIDPKATAKDAARLMNRLEIGCLIVVRQGQVHARR